MKKQQYLYDTDGLADNNAKMNTILLALSLTGVFIFGGLLALLIVFGGYQYSTNPLTRNYLPESPVSAVDPLPYNNSAIDVDDEMEKLYSIKIGENNVISITESERVLLKSIFRKYDRDDDREWGLNEFKLFMHHRLHEDTTFYHLDITKNKVLSKREVLVSLMHLDSVPKVQPYLREKMGPPILSTFNYEYDTDADGGVDQVFFEYCTQFLFRSYDPDRNGVITKKEWNLHQTSDAWFTFNLNEDSKITFDEFVNGFIASGYMQTDERDQELRDDILDFNLKGLAVIDPNDYRDLEFVTNMNEIYSILPDILRRMFLSQAQLAMLIGAGIVVGGLLLMFGGGFFGCIPCITYGAVLVNFGFSTFVGGVIGSGGCLGESNMVYAADHRYILVSDLMIGDQVLNGDGLDKVWFIDDNYNDPYLWMTRLWFNDDEFITLTPNHLLYTMDDDMSYLIRAKELMIGDTLITLNNYTYIQNIDHTLERTRSPITMGGDVVINGILVSSYSHSVEHAQRLHDAATVLRWISKNINAQIAAVITNALYNVVFRGIQYIGCDSIFDFHYSAPIIMAMIAVSVVVFVYKMCYWETSQTKKN